MHTTLNRIKKFSLFAVTLMVWVQLLNGQVKGVAIGFAGSRFMPVGTLSDRFLAATGGGVTFSFPSSDDIQWGGTIEYVRFDRENRDKYVLPRRLENPITKREEMYSFPIPNVFMDLKIAGAMVNGSYKIFSHEYFDVNTALGVGVYRWFYIRGVFSDTVKIDRDADGLFDYTEYLEVPRFTLQDWSLGFTAGIDVNILALAPFSINTGARYKFFVGELWPTLALNFDSVSGLQMGEVFVGIKYYFGN